MRVAGQGNLREYVAASQAAAAGKWRQQATYAAATVAAVHVAGTDVHSPSRRCPRLLVRGHSQAHALSASC